ncbi:MAG: transporter substrate-binding domain-containing protein [Bacilli bacterium]
MKKLKIMSTLASSIAIGCCSIALSSCGGTGNHLAIVHFDQTILGDTQKDLSVSIGIKKGNDELKEKINTSLAKISTSTRNEWMEEAITKHTETATGTDGALTTAPHDSAKPDLIVGLECNYSPFNWTETVATDYTYPIDGKINEYAAGYDVKLAKTIAEDIGYNLIINKMEWDALIPAITTDTITIIIAGMTDTEERRQSIDFTDVYYQSELVLVVNASGELANATSLSDFAGNNIVSQVSTVTDSIIDEWVTSYGVKHLNPLNDFSTCAIAVQNGTADAMTAELPVATSIVNGANV